MPKMKTHRGTKKRFKVTASGKVKRWKALGGHLFEHKTAKKRRGIRQSAIVNDCDAQKVKKLLPYD